MTLAFQPLAYDYGALEPVFEAEDLRRHVEVFHRSHWQAMNEALEPYPELQDHSIEALLRSADRLPQRLREALQRHGGAHANHQFFWKIMQPGGSPMSTALEAEIAAHFGSPAGLQAAFFAAALALDGPGWCFLAVDPTGQQLEVIALPGNDSVLPIGKPGLLCCDLWEHASHRRYPFDRAAWLSAWWPLIHWQTVERRLHGIRAGKTQL